MAEAPIYATGGPAWQVCDQSTPGAVLVVDDALPPAGTYRVASWGLLDIAGTPHRQFVTTAWSRTDAVTQKLGELSNTYDTHMAGGYACTINGVAEVLQTREADKPNWIGFKLDCQDQVNAGNGTVNASMPIRVTSNKSYIVTHADGLALMNALLGWWADQMKNAWSLADQIAQVAATATDDQFDAQLAAIDVAQGWS